MAIISMGEPKWRMLRTIMLAQKKAKGGVPFDQCRLMHRKDIEIRRVEWLVSNQMVDKSGEGDAAKYKVTAKGEAAADLGEYQV